MQSNTIGSISNQNLLLQQLMAMSNNANASVNSSADSSDSAASAGQANSGRPPGLPPPTSGMMGSDLFRQDTLASLMSNQTSDTTSATGSSTTLDTAANALASNLISEFGQNGSLSLSDIETALGSSGGVTSSASSSDASNSDLSSAFSTLDTNGDGKLSSSELAQGLEDMFHSAIQGGPPAPPPDFSQSDGATDSSSAGSSSSSASNSSGTSSTASNSVTSAERALEALLLQYAQAQYGAQAASASQTQSSVAA